MKGALADEPSCQPQSVDPDVTVAMVKCRIILL